MKASSRSESTNNVFQSMATKTMRLIEFVHEYEKAGKKMHQEELEEDYRCNQDVPPKLVKHSGILLHASSLYSCRMFYLFKVEFASTLGVTMEEVNYDGVIRTYSLIEEGHQKVCTVQFNSLNNDVTCSCKMFETLGLLCRHALRVINVKNITQVPTQYILKQ